MFSAGGLLTGFSRPMVGKRRGDASESGRHGGRWTGLLVGVSGPRDGRGVACLGRRSRLLPRSGPVTRRTQVIGIRTALGAGQGQVVKMILREGMMLSLVGSVIGVLMAGAVGSVLATFLIGVAPDRSAHVRLRRRRVRRDHRSRLRGMPAYRGHANFSDGSTPVRVSVQGPRDVIAYRTSESLKKSPVASSNTPAVPSGKLKKRGSGRFPPASPFSVTVCKALSTSPTLNTVWPVKEGAPVIAYTRATDQVAKEKPDAVERLRTDNRTRYRYSGRVLPAKLREGMDESRFGGRRAPTAVPVGSM